MTDSATQPGCLAFFFKLFQSQPGGASGSARAVASFPYQKKDWLFSKAERSFFGVLQHVVADRSIIFAKVRLADLVFITKGAANRQSHQNRINMKHVDFVLCDPDSVKPLLVIELDDSTHDQSKRQARDAFVDQTLAAAGLPILHVRAQQAYNAAGLEAAIRAKLMGDGQR
ncbi:MAG: DUF2726 domain-containing protein [Phycisphaerales bacterium]